MALTASGQLSLGDIATEMGVSLSNVSLTTQSTTGINTNSTSKPNGSIPHAISEFYSYNHSASPPLTSFPSDETRYGASEEACPSGQATIEWYHNGAGTYPTVGDTVYVDPSGTASPIDGVYWMDEPSSYSLSSGVVGEVVPCE